MAMGTMSTTGLDATTRARQLGAELLATVHDPRARSRVTEELAREGRELPSPGLSSTIRGQAVRLRRGDVGQPDRERRLAAAADAIDQVSRLIGTSGESSTASSAEGRDGELFYVDLKDAEWFTRDVLGLSMAAAVMSAGYDAVLEVKRSDWLSTKTRRPPLAEQLGEEQGPRLVPAALVPSLPVPSPGLGEARRATVGDGTSPYEVASGGRRCSGRVVVTGR